ncbi:hypothetical protein SAMN05421770_103205 [Granulicella rosea]|uniref:Secretin/TonB short N-terminal domain-containing protein n=1 Tax=Granulicella rosea TaxID=474952 RepID=A0A239INF4_9BACT|nr:hypothetical protein [Granulicella rosea]SNS95296.1 hypothetical protein SAMN05421770_103205 [Granulicella rosea]
MPAHPSTRLHHSLLGFAALALAPFAGHAQLTPTGQAKPSAAIPATAPTVLPAAPVAPPVPLRPEQQPARRATVTWSGGQLTVQAENSSLNQILRSIAQKTGMKITGGVTEERVYGAYGPASPGEVLNALLDGAGSNMLLVEDDARLPAELILTPRHGGATPPSPSAGASDDRDQDDDRPPQQQRPGPVSGFKPPMRLSAPTPPVSEPPPSPATAATAVTSDNPAAATSSDASATPAASTATTTDQSPNGVKTPQQIYEQLLQMQQKKTAPQE